MNFFSNGIIPTIQQSITRAKIMSEEYRRQYATELIDTYSGFGKPYLQSLIQGTIKNEAVKQSMVNLMVCYPILQNFVNKLSMVYKIQPKRKFYLEGKEVVEEIPQGVVNPDSYEEDPDLYNTLDEMYNKEFIMKIKQAEAMTNLLDTAVYKVNNRENKLFIDFIPNDQCSIIPNTDDPTMMDSIYFLRGIGQINTDIGYQIQPIYEYWNIENFEVQQVGKQTIVQPNRAYDELKQLTDNNALKHLGSGFPPFVVLRSHMAEDDFWSSTDKDVVDTIKQINMAFTELRYLQRYGAFGLKYVVNAKLAQDATTDPTGILEIQSTSNVPGDDTKVTVGEFNNEARIKDLSDSIMSMMKFLYTLKNISLDSLIATKSPSSADSKEIDRESLKEIIKARQDIWSMNEENIFNTALCVYNRDNSKKLPKGLYIKVDFHDADKTAEMLKVEMESWLVKIENDIATKVDWLMSENPDLTEEEAKTLLEKNMAMNENSSISIEGEEDSTDNQELDENGQPIQPAPGTQPKPPIPPAKQNAFQQ